MEGDRPGVIESGSFSLTSPSADGYGMGRRGAGGERHREEEAEGVGEEEEGYGYEHEDDDSDGEEEREVREKRERGGYNLVVDREYLRSLIPPKPRVWTRIRVEFGAALFLLISLAMTTQMGAFSVSDSNTLIAPLLYDGAAVLAYDAQDWKLIDFQYCHGVWGCSEEICVQKNNLSMPLHYTCVQTFSDDCSTDPGTDLMRQMDCYVLAVKLLVVSAACHLVAAAVLVAALFKGDSGKGWRYATAGVMAVGRILMIVAYAEAAFVARKEVAEASGKDGIPDAYWVAEYLSRAVSLAVCVVVDCISLVLVAL